MEELCDGCGFSLEECECCVECGNSPCECEQLFGLCGYLESECECCPECGDYPCVCEDD